MKRVLLFPTLISVLVLSTAHALMLNYSDPAYTLVETPEGQIKVDVEVKVDKNTTEKVEEIRNRVLLQEADKDPLFAMAFVQKLAADGDTQAREISALYQAYRQFFLSGRTTAIANMSSRISCDAAGDATAKKIASYVTALLGRQPIDSSLGDVRSLINKLIPGFEQTLTTKPPKIVYKEQEVTIPQMEGSHWAFPDLIKFNGAYYAAFREAESHVGHKDYGRVRVLKGVFDPSGNIWRWENVALLGKEGYDFRDPRFFETGDHALGMVIGGSKINDQDETESMTPQVAFFKEGQWNISEASVDASVNGPKGQWIWRVTWNPLDNKGYAFAYGKGSTLTVVRTSDGIKYEKIGELKLDPLTDLSEGTLRFKNDGTAIAFIRTRRNGIIATAKSADGYTTWTTQALPFRVGGPNLLVTKNEQNIWAATRYFFLTEDNALDPGTIIGALEGGTIAPLLRLESYGDNSYPGMVLEDDGTATVIYYTSDTTGGTHIYITRVQF